MISFDDYTFSGRLNGVFLRGGITGPDPFLNIRTEEYDENDPHHCSLPHMTMIDMKSIYKCGTCGKRWRYWPGFWLGYPARRWLPWPR